MGPTTTGRNELIEYIEYQQIHYLYYIQRITTTGKKRQFELTHLEDYEKIMVANGWLESIRVAARGTYRYSLRVTKRGESLLEELGLRRIALASLQVGDSTITFLHIDKLQLSDLPEVLTSENYMTRRNADEVYRTLCTQRC